MEPIHIVNAQRLLEQIEQPLNERDLARVAHYLESTPTEQLEVALERLDARKRAVVYRLLPKQRAIDVFEELDPTLQSELVQELQAPEVAAIFEELDPDDRVWLLDELPSSVAQRLLRDLSDRERLLTASVLGYPQNSIGRRMSPEYVSARPEMTVEQALHRVQVRLDHAETIYTLPVIDDGRRVVGVVSLRDLLRAERDTPVEAIMQHAQTAAATEDAELAARRCANLGRLALPIVDSEGRLVGILTIDDAVRILEQEENEDTARQGGVEPLHRPYLSTSVLRIVRSRITWLLVLAVGATLTVQVLSHFEATLEQVTVLALFVPLLIGTGGNTGNQAATTVTRALALRDIGAKDLIRVLAKELRVGALLGALLGAAGFIITGLIYDVQIGVIIGLTLLIVCAVAATVGGVMPLIARAIRVDPAVFSNPFITTFVDAIGLIIYFVIAQAILGL